MKMIFKINVITLRQNFLSEDYYSAIVAESLTFSYFLVDSYVNNINKNRYNVILSKFLLHHENYYPHSWPAQTI